MTTQQQEPIFVQTLNKMGYMTTQLDEYSQRFVDFCHDTKDCAVLEIGTAFGVATLKALNESVSTFCANDVDPAHLEVLKEKAPKEFAEKLELCPGAFPEGLDFKENQFDAILICRVLHFFSPEKVTESFALLKKWLKPGGKLFVVNETPYLKNFQDFIPVYEKRVSSGLKNPGWVDDVQAIAPERGKNLPPKMFFFDVESLEGFAKEADLEVLKCQTFSRDNFPEDIRFDGRESVGLIAQKR